MNLTDQQRVAVQMLIAKVTTQDITGQTRTMLAKVDIVGLMTKNFVKHKQILVTTTVWVVGTGTKQVTTAVQVNMT